MGRGIAWAGSSQLLALQLELVDVGSRLRRRRFPLGMLFWTVSELGRVPRRGEQLRLPVP